MCKDVEGQASMFDPETTPEKSFREELLEAVHQIAAQNIEVIKELRQLRGISANMAVSPARQSSAPVRTIDKYADKDRIVMVGKDGVVDRVFFILNKETSSALNVTPLSRGRITDDLRCVPNAESGTRSTWKVRPDGTAILMCRRSFELQTEFEYTIMEAVINNGIIVHGEIIETS